MAQDLCTLGDVKTALEATTTARDTLLAALITQASDAIMDEVEREFAPITTAAARTLRWDAGTRIVDLAPYDLASVTSVVLSPEDAATSLTVGGAAPDVLFRPLEKPDGVWTSMQLSDLIQVRVSTLLFRFGFMQVQITGNWGFPTIPTNIVRATVVTVVSWARKDTGAFGMEDYDANNPSPLPRPPGYYAIPPAALKLINPFRRFAGFF